MGAPLWQRPRGEWDVTTRTGFELLEGGLAALSQPVGRVFFHRVRRSRGIRIVRECCGSG